MALRSRNKEGTIVKDAKLVVIIDGGWCGKFRNDTT